MQFPHRETNKGFLILHTGFDFLNFVKKIWNLQYIVVELSEESYSNVFLLLKLILILSSAPSIVDQVQDIVFHQHFPKLLRQASLIKHHHFEKQQSLLVNTGARAEVKGFWWRHCYNKGQ